MSNVIQYKGYFTNVEYSQEDQILFGKIEGIRDLVTFECENAGEVEQAFKVRNCTGIYGRQQPNAI